MNFCGGRFQFLQTSGSLPAHLDDNLAYKQPFVKHKNWRIPIWLLVSVRWVLLGNKPPEQITIRAQYGYWSLSFFNFSLDSIIDEMFSWMPLRSQNAVQTKVFWLVTHITRGNVAGLGHVKAVACEQRVRLRRLTATISTYGSCTLGFQHRHWWNVLYFVTAYGSSTSFLGEETMTVSEE